MLFPTEFEWTITTSDLPKINRPCGRCRAVRAFSSTGKFRLNANGSRLDAWLIYSCTSCGKRWNQTVFERRPVSSLTDDYLQALQQNDEHLAERIARENARISSDGETTSFRLERRVHRLRGGMPGDVTLKILNPQRLLVRLDQVLAKGLSVPRRRVLQLIDRDVLLLTATSSKALRRRTPDSIHIQIRPNLLCSEQEFRGLLLGGYISGSD
ncbi:DUF1062 domain-containing protein [Roseibium sp. M-1]